MEYYFKSGCNMRRLLKPRDISFSFPEGWGMRLVDIGFP